MNWIAKLIGHRWAVCSLLFFATTINYIDRQILSLLKPILDDQLHWTNAEFGMVNSAFQGAYGVSLLVFGWLIDKYGTKIGYAISIAAWSLAAMGHALVGSVGGFLWARVALGLGEGGNFPAAIKATGKKIMVVNGNAVAPRTAHEIDGIIRAVGGSCVDGSILRVTSKGKSELRLYVSGPEAAALTQINDEILKIRVVGEKIGNASALKMCYGAFTKGALALGVELLLASHKLGVADEVAAEFEDTQPEVYKWILGRTIGMAPKAYRYVPEMLEVATTFEDAGMTRRMLEGAADMFEMLAKTPLAAETPEESKEKGRTGKEIVKALAAGAA